MVSIRERKPIDLDALVGVAQAVQASDGYPHQPVGDLAAFIESPYALAAWVAEDGDSAVGHVALHSRASPEAESLIQAKTGVSVEGVGVVSRLFVSPGARGRGVGRALLATAGDAARERDLLPVLDVSTAFTSAIALYEGAGWSRIGDIQVTFDGLVIDEHVYVHRRP